ncbi:hypothetical protein G9A89_003313 [Geosiphon pyriformis]|nr:hypothetical protein G9A89_003313 [Geosiphon pyriformis]
MNFVKIIFQDRANQMIEIKNIMKMIQSIFQVRKQADSELGSVDGPFKIERRKKFIRVLTPNYVLSNLPCISLILDEDDFLFMFIIYLMIYVLDAVLKQNYRKHVLRMLLLVPDTLWEIWHTIDQFLFGLEFPGRTNGGVIDHKRIRSEIPGIFWRH